MKICGFKFLPHITPPQHQKLVTWIWIQSGDYYLVWKYQVMHIHVMINSSGICTFRDWLHSKTRLSVSLHWCPKSSLQRAFFQYLKTFAMKHREYLQVLDHRQEMFLSSIFLLFCYSCLIGDFDLLRILLPSTPLPHPMPFYVIQW